MPAYTGTSGRDRIVGTSDDDVIDGLGGNDVLNGADGADIIRGGDGDDQMAGGAGDDILNGGDGQDTIQGGGGNDTIDSIDRPAGLFSPPVPAQRDMVFGGSGDDVITAGRLDVIDGGAGTDNLSINFGFQSTGPVTISVANGFGTVTDGTSFTDVEFVNFNLTEDADISNTGNIRASIDGAGGDDTIRSGLADDVLSGGAGDDFLDAGDGDDQLFGGAGSDTLFGGAGDDATTVGRGGEGADLIDLGDGDDVVRVEDNFNTGQVRLTFTSSEVGNASGADAGTGLNQDGGLAVRFQAEDESGNLVGDVSRFDDEGIQFIAGTQGITFDVRDLVSGAQRGDFFEGVVLGTSGADDLSFFPPFRANDSFYYNGGGGNDTITGGTASDFLVGGAGDDLLDGGAGGTTDTFLGGGGNDTLIHNVSTAGSDFVDLGIGSDIVNVSGSSQVRLTFTSAEVGNGSALDAGSMANQDGGFAVRMQSEFPSGNLSSAVTRIDDEGVTFVAAAGTTFDVRDLVSGAQRGDQFGVVTLGTSAADTLAALDEARAYYINAGAGDDVVTGGTANDFLVGGAGNDSLDGGDGADSFIGGGGNDTITGGLGADTVTHDVSTAGSDTVDLGVGSDTVIVSGASQVRLTFTSSEVGNGSSSDAGTMLNQDGGLAARLQAEDGTGLTTGAVSRFDDEGITYVAAAGTTLDVRDLVAGTARGDFFQAVALGTSGDDTQTALLAGSAYYFNGGGGNDLITGGASTDFLVGGAGDDTLTGGIGGTSDTFLGGAGNDTLNHDVMTAGSDFADLGAGSDIVNVSGSAQVRLIFTSSEVGNGVATDSGTMANQDGGLGVRMQREFPNGNTSSAITRVDDEGITFVAAAGTTFDVRDLVSGTERGDIFGVVSLGTSAGDTMTALQADRSTYLNGGSGNDTISGSLVNDFLVGGAGDDILSGGAGGDRFIGGGGADLFDYNAVSDSTVDQADSIITFEVGIDKIDLRGVASSVTLEMVGSDTYVRFGPNNTGLIVATGVTLTASDILVDGVGAPTEATKSSALTLPAEDDLVSPANPGVFDGGDTGGASDLFDWGRQHTAISHDWMLV